MKVMERSHFHSRLWNSTGVVLLQLFNDLLQYGPNPTLLIETQKQYVLVCIWQEPCGLCYCSSNWRKHTELLNG